MNRLVPHLLCLMLILCACGQAEDTVVKEDLVSPSPLAASLPVSTTSFGAVSIGTDASVMAETDLWMHPFSSDSIWNTPIGRGALFLPADIKPAHFIGVDAEWFIRTKESDPVQDVLAPSDWAKRWPGGRKLATLRVPDDLVIPDAVPGDTPNNCATFLMPDGITLVQLEPACRVEPGVHIVGYPRFGERLDGPGIYGTHWGSGLSAIGGSIRSGELTSDLPIRHALKVNIWGKRYLYYSADSPGFRWPADRSDNYASDNYGGSLTALQMGTLLAIPGHITASALNLKTEPGKKLFQALQEYGAYVADAAGWDAHYFCAERTVPDEVFEAYGLRMHTTEGAFFSDANRLFEALQIVDNNTKKTVGGGSTLPTP